MALSAFILADNIGRKKNTAVGFQRQKEEVGSPPKDLMKLLFNPYKNVGVYAENVWKTIFPIANEKKEGFSNACFCEVRVCAFVAQAVCMKNNFFS